MSPPKKKLKNQKTEPNELRISRVYDAPVKAVWDAWTDPEQVKQWWGPRGFTLTTHSKDLRPGGTWRYTMHGPDGTDYPNVTLYHEVEICSRLVYDHGGSDDRPPLFRVTVEFEEVDGKTFMEMRMALPTPEEVVQTRKFIRKVGGDSTWDRLAEYLVKEKLGKEQFVIHRTFDAPLETMFDIWTKPEHFSQWLPPTGFTMSFIETDVREGGTSFYSMSAGTLTMYGKVRYLEIRRPDRLVYTQEFTDAQGHLSRHPGAPVWPAQMLTTVQLVEEEPGRTRVSVTWEPHGPATPEEVAAFVKERPGMTRGWTGSFDKLEAHLQSVRG
jgi:uncharacterized protein YndB with AHSA1/START domain